MSHITAVRMGGEHDFVAHVLHGDDADADRLWVCVRSGSFPTKSGWLGCWSSKNAKPSGRQIEDFMKALAEKVRAGGRMGPMGPFLDGHYFFGGWETWGMGLPGPLTSMTPASAIAATDSTVDLEVFLHQS
jgi:hypothetical protein